MKQILDKMAQSQPQLERSQDDELLKFYQKQLDFEIPIEADPIWIFSLLDHFQSGENSSLKAICATHPKLANQFLAYLDNRYKYSQIIHYGVHNPRQTIYLLKQRLAFHHNGYAPLAEELTNIYFEYWRSRWLYNTYHRSNTLLSKITLVIYKFLSAVVSFTIILSSVLFALFLARSLNIILSQIEWALLHVASGGQYTQKVEKLPFDEERMFLRLCEGLEEWRYEDITSIEDARLNHINSFKKWPIDETGQRAVESLREVVWQRHLRLIYREQDRGVTHLLLIVKTFYELTTLPLKSSFLFQSVEIALRFRYALAAAVFFILALSICNVPH